MKHTIIEKAALKAKSEETGIPFSNLLAGYVLEELMYLIEDSPFSLFLWLKNSGALGVEQYRKKNLLTLDFAYVTDPRAMKREGIVPGQELSLKMGYVMLAYILKVEKVPDISWKGRASAGDHRVDLEIAGGVRGDDGPDPYPRHGTDRGRPGSGQADFYAVYGRRKADSVSGISGGEYSRGESFLSDPGYGTASGYERLR